MSRRGSQAGSRQKVESDKKDGSEWPCPPLPVCPKNMFVIIVGHLLSFKAPLRDVYLSFKIVIGHLTPGSQGCLHASPALPSPRSTLSLLS